MQCIYTIVCGKSFKMSEHTENVLLQIWQLVIQRDFRPKCDSCRVSQQVCVKALHGDIRIFLSLGETSFAGLVVYLNSKLPVCQDSKLNNLFAH